MWIIPLALFLLGLLLLWKARRQRAQSGVPEGRLLSLDTLPEGDKPPALYDAALDLAGRPDYLVEQGGKLIPVEVKSGRAPKQPYLGHTLQLAAYCYLVYATYGRRPPYGVIRYADRAFAVDFAPALEARLLDVVAEIRRLGVDVAERSHDDAARCRACGYRPICDQALA